jgi:hypothetical protein
MNASFNAICRVRFQGYCAVCTLLVLLLAVARATQLKATLATLGEHVARTDVLEPVLEPYCDNVVAWV